MQKLAHPDGEIATSRAAAAAGVAMGLSSYSTSAMEDVVREGAGKIDYAMQLYVFQNRQTSEALVRRAESMRVFLYIFIFLRLLSLAYDPPPPNRGWI